MAGPPPLVPDPPPALPPASRWSIRRLAAVGVALALAAGLWAVWPADTPKTARPAGRAAEIKGSIKEVDHGTGAVVLEGDLLSIFGVTVFVTPETRIRDGSRSLGLAELRRGMDVRVVWEKQDRWKMARSVELLPAGAADAGASGAADRSRPAANR